MGFAAYAAWLLADYVAVRQDAAQARLLDFAGASARVRALVRALLGLVLVREGGALLALGGCLLLLHGAWLAASAAAEWLSRGAPASIYLPGEVVQPEATTRLARAYRAAIGLPGALSIVEGLAVLAALLWDRVPSEWAVALLVGCAVAILAWVTGALLRVLRLVRQGAVDQAQVIATVTRRAPAFLAYVSMAHGQAKHMVNQWLPAFDALPHEGAVIVREASHLPALAASRLTVVYAPSTRHVEALTVPSVRMAFYMAFGGKNGQLMRDSRIKHLLLLHGDSDKASSASPLARAFDEVWVAGEAAIQRFADAGIDLPRSRFVIVGRPQVAQLPVGPASGRPPLVLYAPTFEGYSDEANYSSLEGMGVGVIRSLIARGDVKVAFKPHPSTGIQRPQMLAALREVEGLVRSAGAAGVVCSDVPTLTLNDWFAEAAVLITDVSSLVSDFLQTERPIVTCNPRGFSPSDFLARFPSQRVSYRLDPQPEGFDAVLNDALTTDSLRQQRVAGKKWILGDLPDGPQHAFAAEVARLA
ncbi:MAG: CDP-glycerol glycerophosphotransferase family protein [Micropruina sp.]|nr:CDP-glycerol glycerophosphotransferase family protein [Micropruina sp.]